MNLGQISEENEQFVNNYKKYGYSTKTQLANEAFKLLRQTKARELREKWRLSAFRELAEIPQDKAWDALDGEDFAQDR
jgi:LAS superfamily LD-carboxypeptidase LdcB